jgi:hypothetical protein
LLPQWVHDFAALLGIASVIVPTAGWLLVRIARMPANRGALRKGRKSVSQPRRVYRERLTWVGEIRADLIYRIIRPDVPWTVDAYVIGRGVFCLIVAAVALVWGAPRSWD